MTASTPRRSRSACQSGTGSAPAYRTARAASVSSSDPGNVTTPIRTREVYPQAVSPQETSQVRHYGRSGTGQRDGLSGTGQRGRPVDALGEHDAGATARRGAQGHLVRVGPHDRETAAGLGEVVAPAERAAPPGRGAALADVGDLEPAGGPVHGRGDGVGGRGLSRVENHVGAGFGGGEQDVGDGVLVDADATQRVTENLTHHGNAQ